MRYAAGTISRYVVRQLSTCTRAIAGASAPVASRILKVIVAPCVVVAGKREEKYAAALVLTGRTDMLAKKEVPPRGLHAKGHACPTESP